MVRRVALLGSLLAMIGFAASPSPARAVLVPGNTAPDFHKTDTDGNPQTLFQYRGQVVVMFLLGYS